MAPGIDAHTPFVLSLNIHHRHQPKTKSPDRNMPSKGLETIPLVPKEIASKSTARLPPQRYYCTPEISTHHPLLKKGSSDNNDTPMTGVVQYRRRCATATGTSKEPLASVAKFSIRGPLRVGLFQQGEIVHETGATAHCLHPSAPVVATTTDTTTLMGTATTGACVVQRRERPATLVDAGKRLPARTGMRLKTSGSGFATFRNNEGTTRPPPPYAWNKKKEHVPVQDVETHGKQGMWCGGNKEGGGNGTVKRRRSCPGSSGRGGGGGATWLCFNNLVRLLLVVVCGLGGVEGFAKLPNGDGGLSATGTAGTLRRAVSDWIDAGGASTSTVVATYGPIEDWDVSDVTNMKHVFFGGNGLGSTFGSFNADLSKWNTSAVTNMWASKCSPSLSVATPSVVVSLNIRQLEFHRITILTRFVILFLCF
jgi:surface protein